MADDGATAIHQVEYALWQSALRYDLCEDVSIHRRQLARFDDDGVAGHQGGSRFACDQEEGEVPRQDAGSHPDRTFKDEDALVRAVALHDLALIAACPLGHII